QEIAQIGVGERFPPGLGHDRASIGWPAGCFNHHRLTGRNAACYAARAPPSMRFYEYEAKSLFARHGTPLLKGRVARTAAEARQIAAEVAGPVVLKSQVLTGGRMKAGGVKFADTPAEAEAAAQAILALEIKGQKPRGVLVEQRAPVAQEYFAA